MKLKIAWFFVLMSFVLSPALAWKSKETSLTHMDDEALSWLIVLNEHEIKAAHMALKKAKDTEVRKFAHFMIKEHTKNLHQTIGFNKSLATSPVKSASYVMLKKRRC